MATPSDSLMPEVPTSGSFGIIPLWRWFFRIGDWIKGLSPSMATRFSVREPIVLTDTTNFAVYSAGTELNAYRQGKTVMLQGVITCLTENYLNESGATIMFASIAPEFRPRNSLFFVCQGSGHDKWTLRVNPTGSLVVARYAAATHPAGVWMPFTAAYLVD